MTAFIRRSRLPAHLVRALSGGPGAPVPPLQGPRQQHADLVLRVGVQVADLVRGFIDGLQVVHGAGDGAVLHLAVDDGPVSVDGVRIELDPEICGPDRHELRRSDGNRRL